MHNLSPILMKPAVMCAIELAPLFALYPSQICYPKRGCGETSPCPSRRIGLTSLRQ